MVSLNYLSNQGFKGIVANRALSCLEGAWNYANCSLFKIETLLSIYFTQRREFYQSNNRE